ncbi:hypothetical protein SAY87_022761 [Trapa incisa]|uniref:Uncharacterized protein n=1 Tax=Trapa incisa TaxID=236973 RepID=A0AAN7K2T4_9MYRT|nr:hypothetical protein SAY87_022761 [Trapa incisa]
MGGAMTAANKMMKPRVESITSGGMVTGGIILLPLVTLLPWRTQFPLVQSHGIIGRKMELPKEEHRQEMSMVGQDGMTPKRMDTRASTKVHPRRLMWVIMESHTPLGVEELSLEVCIKSRAPPKSLCPVTQ